MSARNGDKSRFHRLRKAKIRRRLRTELLQSLVTTAPEHPATEAPAKPPKPAKVKAAEPVAPKAEAPAKPKGEKAKAPKAEKPKDAAQPGEVSRAWTACCCSGDSRFNDRNHRRENHASASRARACRQTGRIDCYAET